MKHIKLFEQMDEEDDWWEKESPFDKLEPRLKIGKHGRDHYVLEELEDGNVRMFDVRIEDGGYYHSKTFEYGIPVNDNTTIKVAGKYRREYRYKDLPKEIKDRLIK